MDKKDLLQLCRYYKGEKDNPFEGKDQTKALLWGYEQKWVEFTIEASTEKETQARKILSTILNDYIRAGMREFEKTDDTPLMLKAILYNRYYYWNEGGDFKEWYKETYMQ